MGGRKSPRDVPKTLVDASKYRAQMPDIDFI